MKQIGVCTAAVALAMILTTAAAEATPVSYNLSGTFENSSYYTGPADGGSFSGTFSVSGLPITPADTPYSYVYLSSFDVVLKNALGQSVFTFQPGTSTGYLSAAYESLFGADYLSFYDGSGDYFMLLLPPGFPGSGSILTQSNGYVSAVEFGGGLANQVNRVASGSISAASSVPTVPEPSTAALFGTAACLAFLALRRNRRPAALDTRAIDV